LAWVAERQQGNAYRPILTGCHLDMVQGSEEPIFPMIRSISQLGGATCTHTKTVQIKVQNGGTETLTAMTIEAELEGNTYTIEWEGELPQYAIENVEIPVEVPFGNHNINVSISKANGQDILCESGAILNCIEWSELEIEGEVEELTLELMQDKFGNHITWSFTTPEGTVLASGGPYTMLASGTGTQIHIEHITIPVDECVKFTIHDDMGNGICCSFGHGYYIVKDSQGNVLFGDTDDGAFGDEASYLISVRSPMPQAEISATEVMNVNYNHADFAAHLTYEGQPDEVGFYCRKVTSSEPMIIPGVYNEFQNILGYTDDLEHSSIYMVKAYAIVNGYTFEGPETTFQTWTEGVAELEQSLKIYPNPTTGVLNIQGEGMTSVEVYNTVGQRVMTQVAGSKGIQLNTENLNNGIYFLRIKANDGNVLNRTFSVAR
jgi:hypothetical protein